MKKKSEHAIVVCCNPGYGFGLISSMNTQHYFGTDADWEIAYDYYTDEERQKISDAFPFNVNWTPISDLMKDVVDKRTDRSPHGALNFYWLAYWLLAHRLLKEKKYKSVCVIQADTFVFVNLDELFKKADEGFLACSEYSFSHINADALPFGDDKAIWNRSMCGIFDAVTFIGQQYTKMPMDTVHFQEEDAFMGESNHSVIALNRSVCRHGTKEKMIRLDRDLWSCDSIWPVTLLRLDGDKVFNSDNQQLSAWHCRWWQVGRVRSEWENNKKTILANSHRQEYMRCFELQESNYNLVKSFMESFNAMKPEIASDIYLKGTIRRPRYEDGEEG
jgi:hypothetical protein